VSPHDRAAAGTKADPWKLRTPTGTSAYEMYHDETLDPTAIVCQVGTTRLRYDIRTIEDLRGRFGMYPPPLLEALGLAEVEHNPKNNRMRAA
jgi:hypothetical protein